MLELKQVSKSFGAKKVIDQLDLTIEDGSILVRYFRLTRQPLHPRH